jgi:hypothetical protein
MAAAGQLNHIGALKMVGVSVLFGVNRRQRKESDGEIDYQAPPEPVRTPPHVALLKSHLVVGKKRVVKVFDLIGKICTKLGKD